MCVNLGNVMEMESCDIQELKVTYLNLNFSAFKYSKWCLFETCFIKWASQKSKWWHIYSMHCWIRKLYNLDQMGKNLCKFIDLNITLRKTGILASLKLLADVIAILMCSIKCFNHVFSLGWLFFLLRSGPISTVYLKLQTVSCLINAE